MATEKQLTYWKSMLGKKSYIRTDETRKKNGMVNLGKKHPFKERPKAKGRKIWNKGKKLPQFSGSNHPMFGKHLSEETRRKLSEKLTGRKPNSGSFTKGQVSLWKGKKGYKQSEETKKKMSDAQKKIGNRPPIMLGNKHPNWKGGISKVNDVIRHSIEGKIWISSVFARDGYTCQKTGIRGGDLTAHHILNFSSHPELRFAIDNGITLGEEVHKEFHKKYGKKNNTREQLNEFLLL